MARKQRAFYSVYERGTDRPIFIHGTSRQCADALGIELDSFYKQVVRTRKDQAPRRYEIIIENSTEEDSEL